MKLYLAGPMRGYPRFNFDNFEKAGIALRKAGYEVVSPIEMDSEDGRDFTSEETVQATVKRLPTGEPDENYYLERDFQLLDHCDGIALLEGWENSRGVSREIYYAISRNKVIKPIEAWVALENNFLHTSSSTEGEIIITDSETGARKGQKPARFDLIPVKPLWELAVHYGKGAQKYADHNWAKGYNFSFNYASALRHLTEFWAGEDMDGDTGSKHVIAAAWHCFALAYNMEVHPEKDNRPHKLLGNNNVPPVPH